MYEGLTTHDIKHIKAIQNDTDKLLSYINDLILLEHSLDYDKGYEDGLADGFGVGSYVRWMSTTTNIYDYSYDDGVIALL